MDIFVNSYLENERSQTILQSNCLSLLSIVYAPVGLFKYISGFDLYGNSKTYLDCIYFLEPQMEANNKYSLTQEDKNKNKTKQKPPLR